MQSWTIWKNLKKNFHNAAANKILEKKKNEAKQGGDNREKKPLRLLKKEEK